MHSGQVILGPKRISSPSSQIKSSVDGEPPGTPLLLYLQRLPLSPPSGSEERAPEGPGQFPAWAVLVLPVHGSSVQLLPFPVCPKWSTTGYPGSQEGAGEAMSPRPPPLVCQGPGLYFERSAIFTSSSPSQLSSFPRQPSPGRRRSRRHQSPPPSSCSRPGPPSRAAHTHISGETSRPPRQPSNAHRRFWRSPASRASPTTTGPDIRGPAGTPSGVVIPAGFQALGIC